MADLYSVLIRLGVDWSRGGLATGLMGGFTSVGFTAGSLFGLLALSGDLLSSFLKRRLGMNSGRWLPLIDQLPEALLPMLVLRRQLGLNATSMLGTVVVFTVLDMIASRGFAARPHRAA